MTMRFVRVAVEKRFQEIDGAKLDGSIGKAEQPAEQVTVLREMRNHVESHGVLQHHQCQIDQIVAARRPSLKGVLQHGKLARFGGFLEGGVGWEKVQIERRKGRGHQHWKLSLHRGKQVHKRMLDRVQIRRAQLSETVAAEKVVGAIDATEGRGGVALIGAPIDGGVQAREGDRREEWVRRVLTRSHVRTAHQQERMTLILMVELWQGTTCFTQLEARADATTVADIQDLGKITHCTRERSISIRTRCCCCC